MLFNIEFDHGEVLEGYVIPDGFSEQPYIRVSDGDGEIGVFLCDQPRPEVAASRRHATGLVGFRLDASKIQDIVSRRTLMIHDARTGLLVYRRPQVASPIARKILRLETQLLPMSRFDRYCGQFFQYELFSVERLGHETTLQAFHLNAVKSIYLSGRLLMRNYEDFLGRGFEGIVLLGDPYYDMAIRIFLLKKMATAQIPYLGDRDKMIMGPAAEYFSGADVANPEQLKVLLKKAPPKVSSVLSSPLTRQFATSSPDQRISRREIAPAIDLLSRFTIVGHINNPVVFQQAVGELLGIPADDLIVPPRHMVLDEIAAALRLLPIAEQMLEEDLIFDHYVRQAMRLEQATSEN